jgi:hypothetical protein
LGRNLDTGTSCEAGGLSGVDPQLGGLADNGGPTDTRLPADTSPALDAAVGCASSMIDQRGVARPIGSACDIGAVERPARAVAPPPEQPPIEPPPHDTVAPIVSGFTATPC